MGRTAIWKVLVEDDDADIWINVFMLLKETGLAVVVDADWRADKPNIYIIMIIKNDLKENDDGYLATEQIGISISESSFLVHSIESYANLP